MKIEILDATVYGQIKFGSVIFKFVAYPYVNLEMVHLKFWT